jgi:hypothetical protein
MSTRESVASTKFEKKNSLSNNAQSYIRKSGRNAGFTGKKLSIFVMVITATLLAMIYAPTLASGTVTQIREVKRAIEQAGFEGNIENAKLRLDKKKAMINVRKITLNVNKEADKLALKEFQQANETKRFTNKMASKAAAASAFRHFFNLPVKFISTLTGVGEDALGIISTTSKNIRRTAVAASGTVAGVSENVGDTARTVTGSVKNTAKFLGPFVFLFTMVSIMAGATGVRASILKQITGMLNGMMRKGIPVTKSVLIKVFNMMYNDTSGKTATTTNAHNRITNNNNNNNKNNNNKNNNNNNNNNKTTATSK